MSDKNPETYKQKYESRLGWRKDRQINNLIELSEITRSSGEDPLNAFRVLYTPGSSDPKDALRWSVLLLTNEATDCYIYGEFQSCILSCGAVIERVLKLEYEEVHDNLPDGRGWTLGRCIHELEWKGTRISPDILELAEQIREPRNNRAHALLEHSDPLLSIMGGKERGIEFLKSGHFLIEPYRGDASRIIEITFKILEKLYKRKS